jgi:hypothetical protein
VGLEVRSEESEESEVEVYCTAEVDLHKGSMMVGGERGMHANVGFGNGCGGEW